MHSAEPKDKLIHDLQAIIQEAEALLKNAAFPLEDGVLSAKERFESTISTAREELQRLEALVIDKTKEVAETTDHFVKENPWQAVGIGAAIGVFIGMLIAKK